MSPSPWTLFADGGARGNPGPAGAGAYLVDESGQPRAEIYKYLGETTNNVAEYSALILGLEETLRQGVKAIQVKLDSQLIVRQLEGTYKVKQPHLQELFAKVQELIEQFTQFSVAHIPREENQEADRLANLAMDEGNPKG